MKTYRNQELLGRQKALQLLDTKHQIVNVEDISLPFDLSGTTICNRYYIECKDRNCSSTAFDTDILEAKKIKAMKEYDPTALHYYFCTFNDGVGRLYHLNKIGIEDVDVSVNEYPVSSTENKGTISKIMYHLPTALAKVFKNG